MRIGIVNDVVMAAEALRRVVTTVPGYEVIWIARDGSEAVGLCDRDQPDLILMDLLMPVMDGVEATRLIATRHSCAILVVTATVEGNATKVFQAMSYGALDAVNTPMLGLGGDLAGAAPLLTKIGTIAKLLGKAAPSSIDAGAGAVSVAQRPAPAIGAAPPLLAIGSSTGGPAALAEVLGALPRRLRVAIAIVQHVDVQFAEGMASWLNERSALPVAIARPGDRLLVGKVLLAASNDHLVVDDRLRLKYVVEPANYPYRPSVDVFFESLANHWPGQGTAVILTGMGRDGAKGLKQLRDRGWHTIAQDRETSVVYGMPKAAAELNAACEVLSLGAISTHLTARLDRAG